MSGQSGTHIKRDVRSYLLRRPANPVFQIVRLRRLALLLMQDLSAAMSRMQT